MAEDLTILIRKRGSLKARLTSFDKHLDGVAILPSLSEADVINLEQRIKLIENILSDYDEIYNQILSKVDDELVDAQATERETFENKYYSSISIAKSLLLKSSRSADIADSGSGSDQGSIVGSQSNLLPIMPPSNQNNDNNNHINLPKLKLITFSGKYSEWVPFYDTFRSLIHDNQSLTPIQKFHYLRSCLESEALQVIQNLELTSANYDAAWSLLERRYKNKQLMIHTHIKGIVEHPKILKESFVSLRDLLDSFQNHIRSLKALDQPTEQWDSILIYLVTDKFDYNTKKEWETIAVKNEATPDIETLIEFLEERCHFLEKVNKTNKQTNVSSKMSYASTQGSKLDCPICKQSHGIYACKSFLDLKPKDRFQEVKKFNLCVNCLRPNHTTTNCKSGYKCRICKKSHNTLLHMSNSQSQPTQTGEQVSSQDSQNKETALSHQSSCYLTQNQILPTAIIKVFDEQGKAHNCTALLDSGSMSNFMTEVLCRRLKLRVSKMNIPVLGLNKSKSQVVGKAIAKVASRFNNYNATLSFLLLPQITEIIPAHSINIANLQIPENVQLGNENFHKPSKIDILIGVDIFWQILRGGHDPKYPYIQNTLFGAIISGTIPHHGSNQRRTACHFTRLDISSQLSRFWEVETLPQEPTLLSEEEAFCEDHFLKTTTREPDGSFVVTIPLKDSPGILGNSREQAEKRFHSLEKRLKANDQSYKMYSDFMLEYEQLGHMTRIDERSDNSTISFYLPHHGVFKKDSLTTKLRAVFDGSCPSTTGVSVNDLHATGPTIQRDLFSILISFRKHIHVVSADCTKMYRSVLVEPSQRPLQRILWRFDSSEELSAYNLNTVTYGLTSSSFLAIRCLFQLAYNVQDQYPNIAHIIKNDMYVDDLLTGGDSIEEVIQICEKISELLASGNFQLRKWASNSPEVLQGIRNPDISHNVLEFDKGGNTKMLGLSWSCTSDEFFFKFIVPSHTNDITKRKVLSIIAQLYDPLGLLCPCTITAKILMQGLWAADLSWDDFLPENLRKQWLSFVEKLPELNKIRIPRQVCFSQSENVELHAFCDSSQSAYGACCYMRSVHPNGQLFVRLVCSKTRVAPLKPLTIPKLELLGAQMLCKLVDSVVNSLGITLQAKYYWCDSTIVLGWINTKPHLLKTFVSNRVVDIQSKSNINEWRYIPTNQNPADLLTRGITPQELKKSALWWTGPSFLSQFDKLEWPSLVEVPPELPEIKLNSRSHISVTNQPVVNFEKFSSLSKLERIMAYCLRFIHNCKVSKNDRKHGCLNPSEIQSSRLILVKLVQKEAFQGEINSLWVNQSVGKKSKLLNLNPFMHSDGIIRVGGRLGNSKYNFNKKFPIVIPGNHHFTTLLIRKEHMRLLHAGPQQVLSSLRESYWPLSARNSVRKVIYNCVTCFRAKPKPSQFLMGNLPEERVSPSFPFQFTGTDYAGPFLVKDRKGRGSKTSKCYICIFICLSTKAIHIELVSSLSTEAFILALRRFVGRRSMPSKIFSDNGTNFIGANSRLKELGKFLKNNTNDIQDILTKENFNWNFIPAYSPHMGGRH